MVEALRATAAVVVTNLQKTGVFGIDDFLIGLEIVSSLYGFYKECHPDQTTVKTYLASEYDGEQFSRRVMRPAVRQARRAVRAKDLDYTDDQIELIAHESLKQAMLADDAVVTACYCGF